VERPLLRHLQYAAMDLSPFLTQAVKTQNPFKGELGHGVVKKVFTKEFKLAAVRRLEQGVSMGEVARALEVNANVLHRWRREFRQGPGNVFPGNGKQRWSEGRIAELERKIGHRRWSWIF
jgi:transposase-like protein